LNHLIPAVLFLGFLLAASPAAAAPISVRSQEGPSYGFLALRSATGQTLAHGESIQIVKADRVDNRLTFRFKDGSLYDETVVFSQQKDFRLLSYRLVQRGPSFSEAQEIAMDRASSTYKSRVGNDTNEGRLDLPPDLYNGMTSVLLKNLPKGTGAEVQVAAFTPKPRLLRMELVPGAEERFFIGDTARTATRYLVKLELRGLTGLVASALGKEPPDVTYWISKGLVPTFVRFEGPMFLKGPSWRIELSAPRWP